MRVSRTASHALHLLADVLIGVVGLLGLCACLLAWRLAEGPIDLTALARHEQAWLLRPGTRLSIGSATVAWDGFHGLDQPLDLRVAGVSLTSPSDAHLGMVHGRITLALGPLLFGRLVPRDIDIDGADISLVRIGDGTLDDGFRPSHPGKTGNAPAQDDGAMPLLQAINAPPAADDGLPWVAQLKRISVRNTNADIRDVRTGAHLHGTAATVDLQRQPAGGFSGSARIDLAAGNAQATLTAQVDVAAGGTHVTANSTPLSPAALAGLTPGLAGLAAIDIPLSIAIDARFGADLAPLSAGLDATLGAGRISAGRGAVAIDGAALHAALSPHELAITGISIRLATPANGHAPPPSLTGSANVTRTDAGLHTVFGIDVPALTLTDLAQYWPEGTGGGARPWMVANVVGGQAHDAHVAGTLDSGADLSGLTLTSLTGGFAADDVTVYWLKPVPPIDHGKLRLVLDGPDALHIDILRGQQGALRLTGGSVRITGLSAKDQFGQIDADFAGPLQDTLALLNHPRLKLLSRRPFDVTDPSGTLQAHLSVQLPLEDKVNLDDIAIKAKASLADVHLGNLALGRDLDQAVLALAVDDDGLTLTGHGLFGAIATSLTVDMDFRDGPAAQVLQHVTADATPNAAQLETSGLPAGIVTGGQASINVDYTSRRDHTDTIDVAADLTGAALATPLDWTKPAGIAASAGAVVTLRDGRLVGLDKLHAEGPGLALASHVDVTAGQLRALVLDRIEIGRSQAQGRIGLPTKDANRLAVVLRGPRLDLAAYLAEKPVPKPPPPPPKAPEKPGVPWSIDLRFDHVDLAANHALSPVTLTAENDGLVIRRAQLDAGTPSAVTASVTTTPAGRVFRVEGADAGTLLTAAGTFDNIHGGRLSLLATAPDSPPDSPIAGTATLLNFQITEAPAVGRLMQAMTLYGLADALRGPGLRFSKLVAPFRWQDGVLSLTNARAFSPSLGLTAQGNIDVRQHKADIAGTIVPAYFFNQLLGNIPLLGKVFSPEKGGGVFAARYSVKGPLADPKIGVNPFSALTPGFLRGLFGPLP